jgi:hypothetical protein
VSNRSDEKKHCFPPPLKMSLFGLFLLQMTKFARTKIHTPDVHSVLTWLTFHLRILFKYKKNRYLCRKSAKWCKIATHLCWQKVKTVCNLSTLAAKNGCENKERISWQTFCRIHCKTLFGALLLSLCLQHQIKPKLLRCMKT